MCKACGGPHEHPAKDPAATAPRTKPTPRFSRNWRGPFRRTPGRLAGLGLIRLYQLTLSGFVGHGCRHIPTCSEYGYEAIARHGLWRGGWMALFRVARCGPGGTTGLDPVPERLAPRLGWWAPWRLWQVGKH
ncbi:membrane protein insertion efficiency factor YidD [Rhizobium rhizosphaerae]|uniref:Putative membrane protein insertion efficiency factor n=1 Tax=Xaviernesmea rhizosphaerae TaxID=1672749 RepID=A0ABX3PII3_9HYPH|nr:membrane protein insertion efficiency factor YidD [Xaviernesmea rhizosphaerae]OQP87953.1 membrane protein insertion efficiency factor YidD [Xaviernesmea rhizosphaerae]